MATKKAPQKEQPKNKKAAEAEDEELVEEDGDDEVEEVGEEDTEASDDSPEDAPKKGGKGNPGNLVPREPVKVPSAVLKEQTKEIRELLKKREELQAAGDKKGLRKVRAALRKAGFRLSNLPGGKLEKKAAPAAEEETVEE